MGLLALEDIQPLLVCPRCRSPLLKRSDCFLCGNQVCDFSRGDGFFIVDGRPVLVDFDRSVLTKTVLIESAAASVVARPGKESLRSRIRKFALGTNAVGRANAAQFRSLLLRGSPKPRLLVVGGGTIGDGAEELYNDPDIEVIGFDVYGSDQVQFVADGHCIPLADGCVDGVWVQAVLEHVLDPWQVVAEIHRVLNNNGLVYSETPFLQSVHEGPFDFTRFTESGHRWLFKRFAAVSSGVVQGPFGQLLWSIDSAARSLFRSRKAGQLAKLLFFWLRFFDSLCSRPFAIDGASCCFLLGRKVDRELSPREMIDWYQGAQRVDG